MKTTALAATAALTLLAACDMQVGDPVANGAETAVAGEIAVPAAVTTTAGLLGEPVEREQALELMHDRHERMEEIGDAMKLVTRELRGESPEMGRIRDGAAKIARLAPQVTGWFPPGSGPDVGKTEARAEIWQKPEHFAAKRTSFQQAAQAFNAAAQAGDSTAIRAAHADLGKTCKACHDPYREEH